MRKKLFGRMLSIILSVTMAFSPSITAFAKEDYGEAATEEIIEDAEEVSGDTDASAFFEGGDQEEAADDNDAYAVSEEADQAEISEDEDSFMDDSETESEIEADAELMDAEPEKSDNLLTAEPDQCGDNLTWTVEEGVLTVSGTGDMWDYTYDSPAPWPKDIVKFVATSG